MNRCDCKVCRFTRRVLRAVGPLEPARKKVIEELLLKWEAAATDAAYWEMNYKGTWPRA